MTRGGRKKGRKIHEGVDNCHPPTSREENATGRETWQNPKHSIHIFNKTTENRRGGGKRGAVKEKGKGDKGATRTRGQVLPEAM